MNRTPKCEAAKAGLTPPEDPAEFEAWRKSLDPDAMGFDGTEYDVGEEHGAED